MIGLVVAWAIRGRLVVLLCVATLVFVGVRAYSQLAMDAVPDITNVQVQVLTNAPGLSPLEVEQLVTRPVELSMSGLPGTTLVRSISRSGVSAVTIVFDDGVALDHARNLVSQRLPAAREAIPSGMGRPEMGPHTTGLGEIYHFTLRWPGHSLRDIRTLMEWEIAPALRSVPGVVEVNPWGAAERQVEVRLREHDMRALGVTQADVEQAILSGGRNAGAGALERGEEQVLVRVDGHFRDPDEIGRQVVTTRQGGVPVLVRDVATVRDGAGLRTSSATVDGKEETLYTMVQMVAGGNARDVSARVKDRLTEIKRRLPPGAEVVPLYDRASLVDRVLGTVGKSLVEGGIIVIVVLVLFLGDIRAGLVVATVIPLAMLGAFALMHATGSSGNLMSLGAIDFGLVVDGSVVVVEGALASMAARNTGAAAALEHEGKTVGRPIAFGVLIIAIVYVPVLLLEGVEGKMFRPMAWTVLFALGTALVLSFTWVPAIASALLPKKAPRDPILVRAARRVYAPVVGWIVSRSALAWGLAILLVAAGAAAAVGRGAEFVPRLEEGDLVMQMTRPPSISVEESVRGSLAVEGAIKRYPEVTTVVTRTGSPDVATDVMGIEQSDVFIMLAPRSTWTSAHDREGLIAKLERDVHGALPGTAFAFTQPIEMRMQELLGGQKSDVGVKVYGDDLTTLTRLAAEVAQTISQVRGAEDVRVEPTTGLPLITVRPDAKKMGRLGVRPESVRAAVEALRAGRVVGTLVENERRFDVTVRFDVPPAAGASAIARAPFALGDGRMLSVGDVAEVTAEDAPAQISRERARRRVLIEANVRGRDLAGFVHDLQQRVDRVAMPPGYHVAYAGQYENLVRASERLAIVVPLTLGSIFILLYLTFGAARPALLIFLNVPVAASGGMISLAARGLPFSISAAVGLVALFGVATLNGVVLLASVRRLEAEGFDRREAARRAALDRLRPVLTTAVVAALGFLPMALATGTGAEVQRPLATVVIGGLATATLLTLGILPALYAGRAPRPRDDGGSVSA